MIEPLKDNSTTAVVLQELVRKFDLQTYFSNRFWGTLDTTIVMNEAR